MKTPNTLARLLDAVASWIGLGVAVTLADGLLEATERKPKPRPRPTQQTDTADNGETETNNQQQGDNTQ
jgi:hypothetical protein